MWAQDDVGRRSLSGSNRHIPASCSTVGAGSAGALNRHWVNMSSAVGEGVLAEGKSAALLYRNMQIVNVLAVPASVAGNTGRTS